MIVPVNRLIVYIPFISEVFSLIGGNDGFQIKRLTGFSMKRYLITSLSFSAFRIYCQVVFSIDVKIDRRTVAVWVRNAAMIGGSFFNGPDGASSSAGAFNRLPVVVSPFIGEPLHIVGRNIDVQIDRCIGGDPKIKIVSLLGFTVFCICCICLQVVLYTDIKIDRNTVAVLVIDSESIISVFRDRPDSTGIDAGASNGIAVAGYPFRGEIVHVISSYGNIQVNRFVRRNIDSPVCGSLFLFAVFIIISCIRLQVVLYTDVKIDRSTVAVLVRDVERIPFVFRDRPDSTGSGAGVFDGIAVVIRPFIGEPVHIVGRYGDI